MTELEHFREFLLNWGFRSVYLFVCLFSFSRKQKQKRPWRKPKILWMQPRLRVLKIRAIWRRRREKATLKKSRKCTQSVTLTLSRFFGEGAVFSQGVGGLSYKLDDDARCLTFGCKLQILVSLRLFGMENHHICPFRYRLVLFIKKFTKVPWHWPHRNLP